MTNFEKFVEQNFSQYRDLGINKRTFEIIDCISQNEDNICQDCVFYDCNCGDTNVIKDWFNKEYTDWSKVEVDTPIFVKHSIDDNWLARHFAMYKNEKVYVFDYGFDSFIYDGLVPRLIDYKYARLATKEEIEEKKNLLKN